jgi:hypothetical protein
MSHVFVATEHALSRAVVVKVLRLELAADVNRERFRREIMLAAQLQHPLIVPVLSAGEQGELLWYTMPFVEGESLREEIRRGTPAATRSATRVLHDVLDALAYAHARGVVHRDIKPGNVLRHGNHSLITDFGVAKALSAALPSSGTTSVGIAIGTPAYMAPEQLAADPRADHRMDIYAVGLLAYELLTGAQAFAASSPQATMAAQLTRLPRDLAEVRPDIPAHLSSLIMRMLAKNPDHRPQSAREALDELEAIITPTGWTASHPVGTRSWKAWGLAAAAIVLAVAGVALATSLSRDATNTSGAGDTIGASRMTVAPSTTTSSTTPTPAAGRADSTRAPVAAEKKAASTTGSDTASVRSPETARLATKAAPSSVPAPPAARRAPPAARRPATPVVSRRVAVFPIRVTSGRDNVTQAAQAIQDSLHRALVASGFTLATDSELLQLISQQNMVGGGVRRAAQAAGIGAVVTIEITTRGDEVTATTQVLDVWRGQTASARETADLDKAMELVDVVRNANRSLDRVSWRSRTDPRRVLLLDVENQTGIDSLSIVARQLGDSLQNAVGRSGAVAIPVDSVIRATRDALERRQLGVRRGAGAIVAASLSRLRMDSVMMRVSVRDMSEDRVLPVIEMRVHRDSMIAAMSQLSVKLGATLNEVNWGPKASP